MQKKATIEVSEGFPFYFPEITGVVTVEAKGQINICTVAMHSHVSFMPPMYAISLAKERYTLQMIKESGEFAFHFITGDHASRFREAGLYSGKDMNKFTTFHIPIVPGVATDAPILEEAFLSLECKVKNIVSVGDHEMVIGQVLYEHYDPTMYREDGALLRDHLNVAVHLGGLQFIRVGEEK
ncbi:flavin reductase family protein [Rubeoparvulum massiliense]|uniref:flavin reductase family protein n=1 Tax=Rubeoparvulum massiliense TaxID=1631346 RepID=UPI00065DD74C|nr:flavin reductase family protein [Rubeoparvulum massiliense]